MLLEPVKPDPRFVCGRPLGIAFDTISDNLIVVDSSSGVFELDLKTGGKKLLVSESIVIESTVRSFNLLLNCNLNHISILAAATTQILQLCCGC